MLSSRMNIANFQNPTKLNALLNQFVAMSQTQSATQTNPALALLNGPTSNGVINLTLPTTTLPDSLSSNSAIALLQATANG